MHNGLIVEAGGYYGAWMTEIIRQLRGHHEPQEERVFYALVQRLKQSTAHPTMVELGSFWAYYSLWVKHELPQTRCLLVEPDPAYLGVGKRNLELNGFKAELLQAAVGAREAASAPFRCDSDGLVRHVPIVSVDGLIDRFDLSRIDVLHCDAQGAELDMLRGASQTLAARRIRFIVISTHQLISGNPRIHQECLDLLAGYGAHIVAEHTVEQSASGDGLIVASLDENDRRFTVTVSRSPRRGWPRIEHWVIRTVWRLGRRRTADRTTDDRER